MRLPSLSCSFSVHAICVQCGNPANQAVTLASYLHIALQPLFINAFCMAIAPAPPSLPDLVAASDSGSSNSDNVTNVNTPTFDVDHADARVAVSALVPNRDERAAGNRSPPGRRPPATLLAVH